MNSFENMIICLLGADTDKVDSILDKIESLEKMDKKEILPEIFHQLVVNLDSNSKREEIWDCLLSCLIPEKIPDEIMEYFIKNRIAIMQLCHMELKDKWLKKLAVYDEAPIYTLSKRIFLNENYSQSEFIDFYQQYLGDKDEISLYLLDTFADAKKRNLLLYLCFQNDKFEHKMRLEWYSVAEQLKNVMDENRIAEIYEKHKNVTMILFSIAGNLFTSESILLKLSTLKGINGANVIRKKSMETLKLKNKCGKKA